MMVAGPGKWRLQKVVEFKIQGSSCVFGHKKEISADWPGRAVIGREGIQGYNRKSPGSQRGQIARCSQLPFDPSASDRCC